MPKISDREKFYHLDISVGSRVFAKVLGYPPWPGKVKSIEDNFIYEIFFYGTNEISKVPSSRVWKFNKANEKRFNKVDDPIFKEALNKVIETEQMIKDHIPRKVWITLESIGFVLEVDLDYKKPTKFKSAKKEKEWKIKSYKDGLELKTALESGELCPSLISEYLSSKENLKPCEKQIIELINKKI